jgi:signal transduction histidine kinase
VTSPAQRRLALPRVVRVEQGSALGGVAVGLGRSLGVDPTLVRLVFALLTFAGGAGIAAYAGAWLWLPLEGGGEPTRRRRIFGLVVLVAASALLLTGLGLAGSLVFPLAVVVLGVAVYRGGLGLPPVLGVIFVLGGVLFFLDRNLANGSSTQLVTPSAVVVGLLAVVGPMVWRLARERDAERAERIRTEERAEMASRVHDSVLQTLALIQREADDPKRVAALARRQERELRGWLYPDSTRVEGDSLSSALEAAASEIEELHGVRVELVRIGDVPLDERVEALVLATREATANAARHAGVDEVAVIAEADDDEVRVYVRDRGAGFDPGGVAPDRQGIAESIRGRMERVGGTATVIAAPGSGTEVELRVARMGE